MLSWSARCFSGCDEPESASRRAVVARSGEQQRLRPPVAYRVLCPHTVEPPQVSARARDRGNLGRVDPLSAGSVGAEQLRAAEVIATLCLATDLGMGFPFEHGLVTTVIAMRLADRLGVNHETAVQTFYGSLLSHAGCTTDAHLAAEVFGGSLTEHLNVVPPESWEGFSMRLPGWGPRCSRS